MRFLKKLWGRSPEDHEKEGDNYFKHQLYGSAKLQYEAALEKHIHKTPLDDSYKIALEKKIEETSEALAQIHVSEAENYMDDELYDEALPLLNLAKELTKKESIHLRIESLIGEINSLTEENTQDTSFDEEDEEEQFQAQIAALPESFQESYLGYGDQFKEGYIALNRGNFDLAFEKLSQAKKCQKNEKHHIDFELASACIHTNRTQEAKTLLETYISHFPHEIRAHEFLCEIYWENGDYARVDSLLETLPENIKKSEFFYLLKSENLYLRDECAEAKKVLENFLNLHGWRSSIARSLGRCYEKENDILGAIRIYQELISRCQQCGNHIDTYIKGRYADLRFQNGERTPSLIEFYLSLTQEDPDQAAEHYQKISQIYTANGSPDQAKHFSRIAEKISHKPE